MAEAQLTLTRLNRFPIKGLSAEQLETVTLDAGQGIPGDRFFGFARHGSGFDPQNPQPLPKDRFVVLANQAALAGLKTRFDPRTNTLEIRSAQGRQFDMGSTEGRDAAALYLYETLALSDPEPPTFVSSTPHRFTDVSVVSSQMMNAVSVLNLASVRAVEERLEVEIDPARFRANLEIDGLPPFVELDSVGSTFHLGDVTLRILARTKRCAATEVNPDTAERDLKLPYLLRKELGHMDMGIYAEVVSGGTLAIGQTGHFSG